MTSIAFEEFGGQGPLLHFSHANAYPPGCYRNLLNSLSTKYRILAAYHRPLWPDSNPQDVDSWHAIAADLVHFFDQQGLDNVIGVGHSLGAVATMMASLERPDLFRALVLIDPVILSPAVLELIETQSQTPELLESPLATIASKRRNRWDSQIDAFEHFRSKQVFNGWSDEAIWDYVQAGLSYDDNGQYRLRYSPAWEARIYSLVPTDVWELIPWLGHPTLAIRGQLSDTLDRESWRLWQRIQPDATFIEINDVSHLLTMEKPLEIAADITSFLTTQL